MLLKIRSNQDKQKVTDYIDRLPDKHYDIEIKLKKEIRTLPQNKLYWLWLTCIMQETGNDKDELHIFFARKFLEKTTSNIFSEQIEKYQSTTKLDTKQFTDYLERIRQFSSVEIGVNLPNPDDLHFAEFYEQYKAFI